MNPEQAVQLLKLLHSIDLTLWLMLQVMLFCLGGLIVFVWKKLRL